MKSKSIVLLACIFFILPLAAQQAAPAADWTSFQFLLGEWVGEGSGSPGQGGGGFSFAADLQGQILVRRNHTEFPAGQGRPAAVHDDLLIVSQEPDGTKAVYWDNEGHVIRYLVEFPAENLIIFISEKQSGAPRFRLFYQKLGDSKVDILFEMAAPDKPDEFRVYLHGSARKK
jgi:hypothetical protein